MYRRIIGAVSLPELNSAEATQRQADSWRAQEILVDAAEKCVATPRKAE
jgi:hypothetical protein